MSSSRKTTIVSRDYQASPDHCARALALLLKKSMNKAAEPDAAVKVKHEEEVSDVKQLSR